MQINSCQSLKSYFFYLLFAIFSNSTSTAQNLEEYNIKWTETGNSPLWSMPVGGCDVGCNIWLDKGDIYFYFGRDNSMDENNALLKSGRIKVSLFPNPFAAFSQELKLENGYVEIAGKNGDLSVNTRLWVETDRPFIHFDISSNKNIEVRTEYQYWRFEKMPLKERWVTPSYIDYPGNDIYWYPDTVKQVGENLIFYHQNDNRDLVIDKEMAQQDLLVHKDAIWNPLKDFIFGGIIYANGQKIIEKNSGTYLHCPYLSIGMASVQPSKKFNIDILMYSTHTDDPESWEAEVLANKQKSDFDKEFQSHQVWWKEFWNRSWISINQDNPDPADSVWQVARNYNIFRYQMGCNSKGEYPTKFNGGLFTFDPVLINERFIDETPDFRAWGGGVMTAQNQRLLYWPLLKTGDYSFMPSQFDFYRRALKTAEIRTKEYWGHDGACFTDQMNQAGLVCGREYGWNRTEDIERGLQWSPYHEYYFTSQLEFSYMILEYYRFSGKDISVYVPLIKSSITFFDQHYRYRATQHFGQEFSDEGMYIFYPCMALETYTGNVKNPSDVIAALTVLTRELQTLPDKWVSDEEKKYYKEMGSRLPAMPRRVMNGFETISPAEQWDRIINQELPQLYPVFPWGIFGIGKQELELAINTWNHGAEKAIQKNHISWHQDAIFCARMGLTDEAKDITLKKLSDADRPFPTFWGPGHDWVPDHNWGGSGMIGLQEMLMQTSGEEIRLFPAWPKDWDVNFKLHAPFNTTVEGELKNGEVKSLKVIPKSREKDVIVMLMSTE
jgi:hypothetical protein